MQPSDDVRELRHQGEGQRALRGQAIEEAVLVEAPHHDDPVHGVADAADREAAVRLACDALGFQVDVRRRARVEADFSLARRAPQVDGGEVEKIVADGAFQFVRAVAREEDVGAVRVDAFHGVAAVGGGVRRGTR